MLADTMSETAKLEAEYEQIQLELSKRKKDKVTLVAGYQQAQKEWNNKVRADVLKVNLQDDE